VLASFRSIETRRALIRSTNTGISAFVDPAGRLTHRTGQWTQEVLVAPVPMIDDGSSTIYMMLGDVYGWGALALVALGLVRSRKKKEELAATPSEADMPARSAAKAAKSAKAKRA
jgi:apolipoprotein N-acyltransferase